LATVRLNEPLQDARVELVRGELRLPVTVALSEDGTVFLTLTVNEPLAPGSLPVFTWADPPGDPGFSTFVSEAGLGYTFSTTVDAALAADRYRLLSVFIVDDAGNAAEVDVGSVLGAAPDWSSTTSRRGCWPSSPRLSSPTRASVSSSGWCTRARRPATLGRHLRRLGCAAVAAHVERVQGALSAEERAARTGCFHRAVRRRHPSTTRSTIGTVQIVFTWLP
jgi:hypothetical protein